MARPRQWGGPFALFFTYGSGRNRRRVKAGSWQLPRYRYGWSKPGWCDEALRAICRTTGGIRALATVLCSSRSRVRGLPPPVVARNRAIGASGGRAGTYPVLVRGQNGGEIINLTKRLIKE